VSCTSRSGDPGTTEAKCSAAAGGGSHIASPAPTPTTRLTPFADKLISKNQSAFIPARFILEGAITLHEIRHELRVSKSIGIILKLDFEKASDKVRWSFLIEVLKQKNFPDTWIEWIIQCVEACKVGVKINGTRRSFFNTHKKLRQSDPPSPLLFNLVSDAPRTMLDKARLSGQIIWGWGDYPFAIR
jgi:hypothetical protein